MLLARAVRCRVPFQGRGWARWSVQALRPMSAAAASNDSRVAEPLEAMSLPGGGSNLQAAAAADRQQPAPDARVTRVAVAQMTSIGSTEANFNTVSRLAKVRA